jgi:hypothetical protein
MPQRVLWAVGSCRVELSYNTLLQRLRGGSERGRMAPLSTVLYLGTFYIYLPYGGASRMTAFGEGGSVMLHGETSGAALWEALENEKWCCLLN